MCDSQELYERCTSSDLHEVHAGFQQLGTCLIPAVRKRLNKDRFDATVVEDCIQEALRDIWQNMKRGNGPKSPKTFWVWALTIAQRRCLDRIRYESRRPMEALTDAMAEGNMQPVVSAAGSSVDQPETQSLVVEQKVMLLLSIRNHPKVSSKSKTVLLDGFLFEKTDRELAHSLLTPEGNIRLIRHRNLEKLRKDDNFMTNLRKLSIE